MEPTNKWSGAFWRDLAERAGATLVGALLTLLATTQITDVDAELAWTLILLPTLVSVLKGLGANLANSESGASLLPPQNDPAAGDAIAGEGGAVNWLAVLAVAVVVVALVILFNNFDIVGDNGGK